MTALLMIPIPLPKQLHFSTLAKTSLPPLKMPFQQPISLHPLPHLERSGQSTSLLVSMISNRPPNHRLSAHQHQKEHPNQTAELLLALKVGKERSKRVKRQMVLLLTLPLKKLRPQKSVIGSYPLCLSTRLSLRRFVMVQKVMIGKCETFLEVSWSLVVGPRLRASMLSLKQS